MAAAIEDHYRPQGPNDAVPTDPVAVAVALADKLDMLVGFWAIDEKPTGSKDPYALRRAALGVIRTVIENGLFSTLVDICEKHRQSVVKDVDTAALKAQMAKQNVGIFGSPASLSVSRNINERIINTQIADLLSFFHDRLKVYLRDQGARYDLIDAVIADDADDLLLIVRRVEALSEFLATTDGENLLAGAKRAANIVADAEKKGTAIGRDGRCKALRDR